MDDLQNPYHQDQSPFRASAQQLGQQSAQQPAVRPHGNPSCWPASFPVRWGARAETLALEATAADAAARYTSGIDYDPYL